MGTTFQDFGFQDYSTWNVNIFRILILIFHDFNTQDYSIWDVLWDYDWEQWSCCKINHIGENVSISEQETLNGKQYSICLS